MSQFQSSGTLQKSVSSISITKAERFPPYKVNCDNIYSLPSSKSLRSTSQGYGTKYDFTNMAGKDTPAPCTYNIKTVFNGKEKGKGVILGQKFKSAQFDGTNVPGVGSYFLSKENKSRIPITVKSRTMFFYGK